MLTSLDLWLKVCAEKNDYPFLPTVVKTMIYTSFQASTQLRIMTTTHPHTTFGTERMTSGCSHRQIIEQLI